MMRRQHQHHQDQQSRMFSELSSIIFNLLRSPVPFTDEPPPELPPSMWRRRTGSAAQITPAGFASLMLGVSIALMLCGSVTFFLGFLLMPWVLGLVMVLYVVGIVSTVSMFGRSLLCYALGPPPSPRKDIPAWKLL